MSERPESEAGFVPPVYPFDKLTEFDKLASRLDGGMVDLSVGTPCDAPSPKVVEALGHSGSERGYPAALGSSELREAAARWIERRFKITLDPASELAACIGTKEFVAGVPHWLRLRSPRLPDLRDGGAARQVPGGRRSRTTRRVFRPGGGRSRGCRACALSLGEQPRQSGRSAGGPRRVRSLGPRPRRPCLLRRVLCRVHLGGPRAIDPRRRPRRRRGGSLALEALQSCGRAFRHLRRRPGARRLPGSAPTPRRLHGARTSAARLGGRVRRRRERCLTAARLQRAALLSRRRLDRGRDPGDDARRGFLSVGSRARPVIRRRHSEPGVLDGQVARRARRGVGESWRCLRADWPEPRPLRARPAERAP